MPKDLLSDEMQARVARGIAGGAPEEEPAATEEAPESAGGTSPAPNAAEPAGTTPSTETPREESRDAKDDAPPPEAEPKSIPYARFKEVIDEKNGLMERQKRYEEDMARRVDEQARANVATALARLAIEHPEVAPYLRGEKPEAEEKLPDDPVQREIHILKREAEEGKRFRAELEQKQFLNDLESKIDSAVEKSEIVNRWRGKNDRLERLINGTIIHRVLADPYKADAEKVVEDVAQSLRDIEESVKASFKQDKKETANRIPAGAGTSAAPPPGVPRKRFSLDKPNDLSRAVAAAMEASMRSQE